MNIQTHTKTIEIINGRTLLVLSRKNGGIIQIKDRKTNTVYLDVPEDKISSEARLMRIIAPTPMWGGQYAETTDAPAPEISCVGDTVKLSYRELFSGAGQHKPLSISLEVTIGPGIQKDEIAFSATLDNRGKCDILEVMFPGVGGFSETAPNGQKVALTVGAGTQSFLSDQLPRNAGTTYARAHQRTFFRYPSDMGAPWCDVSVSAGGISYINYTRTPLTGGFMVENLAGYKPGCRCLLAWVARPLIRPGTKWKSSPIAVCAHASDWHHTADRYGKWVSTWHRAPGKKELRTSIGFQNVFLRGFDGTPINPMDSIAQCARDGRKYGVDHLSIWDYIMLGNYCKYDDLGLLDYPLEEQKILQQGLAQARREGTNVSALINFRLTDPTSSLYKNEEHQEVLRTYRGSAVSQNFAGSHYGSGLFSDHLAQMCQVLSPRSESHRKRVLQMTDEYLRMGYQSMFHDQPFEYYDYHLRDANDSPDDVYVHCLSLIQQVRGKLRKNNPDSMMIGECLDIFGSEQIDLWMAWYSDNEVVRRLSYAFPMTMICIVVDSNLQLATRGFAMGAYLCLCTHGLEKTLAAEPVLGEHVAKLAALRKKCAARTCYGRFRDNQGISVDATGDAYACAYDSEEGPAVVVASGSKGGSLKVRLDPSCFNSPLGKTGKVFHLDGSSSEIPKTDEFEMKLGPDNAAIVYC